MRARLLLVIPAAAAAALLGACGSEDSNDISSNERTGYLTALKAANAQFSTDDAAVDAGKKACEDLKAGKSVSEVRESVPEGKGLAVVAAAVAAFCPDQAGKATDELPSMPNISIPSLPE